MIKINRLTKNYSKKIVLQDVSFHVNQGEVFGVLGSNGAGKSTLLSILATIQKASSGEVIINGSSILNDKKEIRSFIGYVPQELALLDELTVKENLLFWSKFCKEGLSIDSLYELCSKVRLTEQWEEKVARLSGGMKRKLNIITALIHNPAIILLDEPTVGIDIESKVEINQYISTLAKEGKTIIYITHDVHEIIHTIDRFVVLQKGTVKFLGTMKEAREMLEEQGQKLSLDEDVIYQLLKQECLNTN